MGKSKPAPSKPKTGVPPVKTERSPRSGGRGK